MSNSASGQHERQTASLKEVDARFYSAIGRFIAEFSVVETLLKVKVKEAIKLSDEYFAAIMSHDFSMLCTIAQDVLSRGKVEAHKKHLMTIIRKCRDLNDHRVRIVHGRWLISSSQGWVIHTSRQKLKTEEFYFPSNAQEIAAQADTAHALWTEIIDL